MKMAGSLLACLWLSACATQGGLGYNWGNYDEMLYQSYKDVNRTEAMRVGLEKHLAKLEATGRVVPPGLYAELGTIYLQAGDSERAIHFYTREQDAWPESRGLMAVMISNLERRRPASDATEAQP